MQIKGKARKYCKAGRGAGRTEIAFTLKTD